MHIEQREDGWWVASSLDWVDDNGPYDTEEEAIGALQAAKRFLKYCDEPGFMTSEETPK